jgi:hypothetical protein
MPKRIQLSRKKGWRLPPNTVTVARPTRWGNPFVIGEHGTRAECVGLYGKLIAGNKVTVGDPAALKATRAYVAEHIGELLGKNLACWCPLDEPCHADVLMSLANERKMGSVKQPRSNK